MAEEKNEKSEKNENKGSIGASYFFRNLFKVMGGEHETLLTGDDEYAKRLGYKGRNPNKRTWPKYIKPNERPAFPKYGELSAYPASVFGSDEGCKEFIEAEQTNLIEYRKKRDENFKKERDDRDKAEKEKKQRLEAMYNRQAA